MIEPERGTKMAKKNEAVTSGPFRPPVTVRVAEGNTVVHDEKSYSGGDILDLPARTAEHLELAGHVEVLGGNP